MPIQRRLTTRLWGTFKRVFPRCGMISQAIAFNVFLAFFPTLLLAVGLASTWIGSRTALLDAIRNFTELLPPGSQAIVGDFLSRRGPDVWKFALLGWAGSLIGGSQVMKLLMEGIHLIYGDEEGSGFLHRQLRGLLLLLITVAPVLIAGILGVFGRPLRHWVTGVIGVHTFLNGLWLVFGGLAAVIGLLIWMQISAVIVFLGAAWNAETDEMRVN